MELSKTQVVHDLAIACVNGVIRDKVIKENKLSEYGITGVDELTSDALLAYEQAYNEIFPLIVISNVED